MRANNGEPGEGAGVGGLLQKISQDPLAPSSVDIDRAVHRGRAVRRFRGVMASGLAMVAIAGVGVGVAYVRDTLPARAVTAGAAGCTVSKLDLPPGIKHAHRLVGDPSGRYFAAEGVPENGGEPVGILWDNGVPEVISVPGRYVLPKAVNEHGTVVGTHDDKGRDGRLFRYADGSLVDLPGGADGGTPDSAAINSGGVIVATMNRLPSSTSYVAKYAAGSNQPVTLPGQGDGKRYQAVSVAADGTVFGAQSESQKVDPQVVKWAPDGAKTTVTHPAGFPQNGVFGSTTSARWLLVRDMARSMMSGSGTDALLWNTETGAGQVVGSIHPNAANAAGHLAGAEGNPGNQRPAVLRDGVVTQLPTPQPNENGEVLAIGDNGTMAGRVSATPNDASKFSTVIWRGC